MIQVIDFQSYLIELTHISMDGFPIPQPYMDQGIEALMQLSTISKMGGKQST